MVVKGNVWLRGCKGSLTIFDELTAHTAQRATAVQAAEVSVLHHLVSYAHLVRCRLLLALRSRAVLCALSTRQKLIGWREKVRMQRHTQILPKTMVEFF